MGSFGGSGAESPTAGGSVGAPWATLWPMDLMDPAKPPAGVMSRGGPKFTVQAARAPRIEKFVLCLPGLYKHCLLLPLKNIKEQIIQLNSLHSLILI